MLAMVLGGWPYDILVTIVVSIAAIEWVQLAARGGHRASGGLTLVWVWLIIADRILTEVNLLAPGLALLLLLTLGWSIIRFRQGTSNSMVGFAFTLAGGLFLGWLGSHMIALRALPDGGWWTGLAIPSVWIADSAAYSVGKRWGRNKLIPDVSPKKTREGYLAGIVLGALGGAGLAILWRAMGAGSAMTPIHGLVIGLGAGAIGPMGDLGISTFKRQVGAKDTGGLLPGHGGFLDRLDALIVTVPLGYYYVIGIVL